MASRAKKQAKMSDTAAIRIAKNAMQPRAEVGPAQQVQRLDKRGTSGEALYTPPKKKKR